MIPKKNTDFNEPERLQREDAVLTTLSEALVPFLPFLIVDVIPY